MLEREDVPVRLNVSGRTLYQILKNMIVHDFGLTREVVLAKFAEIMRVQDIAREWFGGAAARAFVRATLVEIMPPIIREEVTKEIRGRVNISLGDR